jgi:serine/threonine protein kinase
MVPSAPQIGGAPEQQLRQACAELDRRLRGGEACRAERFLALTPLLAAQEDWAVELIYTEFVAREELGQRPTPEEFYARFPRWKERLSRQFQVHDLLREGLLATAPRPGEVVPVPAAPPGRLGPYELLEEVARGGCGVVYKAWQQGLERVVAVKALRPEYGHLLRARRRFCHEARVMAALRHRHIMPVHEIGESDGAIYFSMDWAAGGSLASAGGAWEPQRLAALLETVARAVHDAHERGVIHCDLKPSNILLDDRGEPLVSDFGLARLPAGSDLDDPGALVGTPAYMAPEQLDGQGRTVGPATDVWALGVVLYELGTGRRPFAAATLAELYAAICQREPAPVAEAGLGAVCRRCLAKEPGRRYGSAAELAEALRACLDG